ncbi:uncharacterized protein LOC144703435 [Wolffia australiana]
MANRLYAIAVLLFVSMLFATAVSQRKNPPRPVTPLPPKRTPPPPPPSLPPSIGSCPVFPSNLDVCASTVDALRAGQVAPISNCCDNLNAYAADGPRCACNAARRSLFGTGVIIPQDVIALLNFCGFSVSPDFNCT